MIGKASSSLAPCTRTSVGSPNAPYSMSGGKPRPTPRTARPPLRWSSVVTSFATFHGRRRGTGVTSVPRRTREVRAAIAPSSTPRIMDRGVRGHVKLEVIPEKIAVPVGGLDGHCQLDQRPRVANHRHAHAEPHRAKLHRHVRCLPLGYDIWPEPARRREHPSECDAIHAVPSGARHRRCAPPRCVR